MFLKRLQYDNKEEIELAIKDWNNGHERFGNVDSDMKRLPAPELPEGFKGQAI